MSASIRSDHWPAFVSDQAHQSDGLQIPKSDQQFAALIPKGQPPAAQALAQGDHLGDFLQFRGCVETGLKPVIGNPAAQMMDVMQSDVSGKPLKQRRKLEI